MDSERWKEVERLYHCVLATPGGAREAVLDQSCSNDPELRREVESLLDARDHAGSFLSPLDLRPHVAGLGSGLSALVTGSAIGPYQILSSLGAGGMGEVYRARDTRLDRDIALKILPAHFTTDAGYVARFRQEAKAASALNHPNILTIYDIGQEGGIWFIATELIEGVTLRERMAAGKLPVAEAIPIAVQCAAALGAAHRAGIVHRDVKPENLMLRADGVVKVVDFGLARISASGPEQFLDVAQTGGVMGTPRYMSPEQARGEKLDPRSDIFGLGAVLYEMVAGRPAFPGSTTAEIFAALLEKDPSPAGCALDAILSKALQKDRGSRYQAMEEFGNDLRQVDLQEHPVTPRFSQPGPGKHPAGKPYAARLAKAAGALTLVAGLVLAWREWTAAGRTVPDAPLTVVPLTSVTGPKDFAAFSPDGGQIAFSWNGGREGVLERHIYVKPVVTGDPLQLTSAAEDDILPAWSPDGRNIAFVRRMPGPEFVVYSVPATGGPERRIASGGLGVSWSPDGKWLALANRPVPQGSGAIFVLSLDTGERRELTFPRNSRDESPVYSPNGQWIAFMRVRADRDVFIVPARGGPARQLTFDSRPKLGVLTWTADNRELVYSTQREYGGEGLWRVPVNGGQARRLSGALQFAGNPNISRQGDRVAYTESWVDTNIYLSTATGLSMSGVPGPFGQPNKIIASSREDHSPSFSPDGERIAFVSNRTGHSEIWTARRDGSAAVQLTNFEGFTGTPRWSPDGQSIAFDCIIKSNPDIWIVAAAGGAARQLTTDPAQDTKPSWSRDGAWIYFNSGRSGTDQIWKIRPDGSGATQLTWGGGREPLPAADGQNVYYTKSNNIGGSAVWSVPAGGGPEKPLAGMEHYNGISRAWGLLDKGIYFVSGEPGARREAIRFFSFDTRRVIPLEAWQERAQWSGPNVAISADGRYLLTVQTDQQANDLMMIRNFH